MNQALLERYTHKQIKLTLRNGSIFTGKIVEFLGDNLLIKDKFGCDVTINLAAVDSVAEASQ